MADRSFVIAAFYRFVHLHNYYDMRSMLLDFCVGCGMTGTVILAEQGINATVSGSGGAISEFFSFLDLDDRLAGIKHHKSYADKSPFSKMKVLLKSEVVRLGIEDFDCSSSGVYIEPEAWDAFVSQRGVHVIDTRNDYEIRFGRFRSSINPGTSTFREFPEWARKWAEDKDKDDCVAMYCTGGIRCEKSTAFMKSLGFKNVYHLKGGILNYLETKKNMSCTWEGDCFVFDDRVAVDRNVLPSRDLKCVECAEKVHSVDLNSITRGHVVCGRCREEAAAPASMG
ncbi:oxygen-dependent tRNA uridine(34) hydroxylase TrhO [Anaplasma platys]|nr:rhodanese-like domain-containing protein [Anaplasma platys]